MGGSDNATDRATPQVISQQVNGISRINGDSSVPRHGAIFRVPNTITNEPAIRHNGVEAANNPALDVTPILRVVEPDMHQSAMMRAAPSTNNTLPQPEDPLSSELSGPLPLVLSRQQWTDRRNSRAAVAIDWSQGSSWNGLASQQDRTTLSNWHDEQPSDEPYHIIEEIDHLELPHDTSQLVPNRSSGSDIVAVAGSSPRNPEQAD